MGGKGREVCICYLFTEVFKLNFAVTLMNSLVWRWSLVKDGQIDGSRNLSLFYTEVEQAG